MFRIHWGSMKNSNCRDDLPNIKAPALLLMGDAGVAANEAELELCTGAIPSHTETRFIPNSGGTYFMIEEPEATADALLEWTSRHPAAGEPAEVVAAA